MSKSFHDVVAKIKAIANELGHVPNRQEMMANGISDWSIRHFGGVNKLISAAGLETYSGKQSPRIIDPKILIYDIELSLFEVRTFRMWDQTIRPEQIKKDQYVMSWAAKWLGEKKIFYDDQSKVEDQENDKDLIAKLRDLLDEADIVVTYNGKKFDEKKIRARLAKHKLRQPSSFIHIDVLTIVKKYFSFPSHSLGYVCKQINKTHFKIEVNEFGGMELWIECMAKNKKAWKLMQTYNKGDILALEELYLNVRHLDAGFNPNVFRDNIDNICSCGSENIQQSGYSYTKTGRFLRYICQDCGANYKRKENQLSTKKKELMLR